MEAVTTSAKATPTDRYHDEAVESRLRERAFDVEDWYPVLAAFTPRTKWAALPISVSKAFIAVYRWRYCRDVLPSPEQFAEVQTLTSICSGLVAMFPSGAFVRLSTRSPKDAAPFDAGAFAALKAQLVADLGPSATPDDVTNATLRAYFGATFDSMRVSSGAEAAELLLRSERAFTDILRAVEASEVYNLAIIAREWDSHIDPEYEFRGFVCNGELTALSQYNHYIFVPALASDRVKAHIFIVIQEYWQTCIRPVLGVHAEYRSCIVDFAVRVPRELVASMAASAVSAAPFAQVLALAATGSHDDSAGATDRSVDKGTVVTEPSVAGDDSTGHGVAAPSRTTVRVIELNPFTTTTGAALFHWRVDSDVLHGRAPFEFRVHTHSLPDRGDLAEVLLESASDMSCHLPLSQVWNPRALESSGGSLHLAPAPGNTGTVVTATSTPGTSGGVSTVSRSRSEQAATPGPVKPCVIQ